MGAGVAPRRGLWEQLGLGELEFAARSGAGNALHGDGGSVAEYEAGLGPRELQQEDQVLVSRAGLA